MIIDKNSNDERIERIKKTLQTANLDALVCTLPTNILMLSGYWPVVGTALAVATREGQVAVLAPPDEEELAQLGWASRIETFQPGSLSKLTTPVEAIHAPLAQLVQNLGIGQGRIGYEGTDMFQPASYASMHLYGAAMAGLLAGVMPQATLVDAYYELVQLRASMTPAEIGQMRTACEVAAFGFQLGANQLRVGLRETEAAANFESQFSIQGVGYKQTERAGGFAFCMSGPNSALAGGAYARSRNRQLEEGDLVLVHVNSYVDGYWTDITRTYCLGEPTQRQRDMYQAILEARAAAIQAIKPGVKAADVDATARKVLTERGFGKEFTHGLGHNVGFTAINGYAKPSLHPASDDTLEVGMVFNVEPAIYFKGYGGMRHCDVVAITANEVEILTPFQSDLERLIIK